MATKENLQEAFAGESQANRKYTAFAQAADKGRYPMVAKLFRAAAEAETVHALLHLKNLGGIGDTLQNLEDAIEGETHEFTNMYPTFLKEAKAEGETAAQRVFQWANAVEETHANLYKQALATVKNGSDLATESIWVCSCCGHTVIGDRPAKCEVCGASGEKFNEIK